MRAVFLCITTTLAMITGLLTLVSLISSIWMGIDWRFLLFIGPQFVVWSITAWVTFLMISSD